MQRGKNVYPSFFYKKNVGGRRPLVPVRALILLKTWRYISRLLTYLLT